MKKAEPEIRNLFTQYNDSLTKKKKEISEALTKWGEVLIAQVKEHVTNQKVFLEQHFTKQKSFLDDERKKFVADIVVQEKKKDNEQIDRLLAECKALKRNLPIHEEFQKPISWIRVTTEEELAATILSEISTQKPEENPSQNGSTEVTDNGTGNTASGSRRPSLKPGSATARPPSRQVGENRLEHDSSAAGTDASKTDEKSENELMDKCPICFMIFPKSMGKQDRLVHADEHYIDD